MKRFATTTALLLALSAGLPTYAAPDGAPPHHRHWQEKLAKLPPEKAAMVKDAMQKGREAHRADFEKLKELRREQKAILTAKDFNRDAYLSNAKKAQSLHARLAEDRAKTIADLAPKLTPEERAVLVERRHRMGPPPPDAEPKE